MSDMGLYERLVYFSLSLLLFRLLWFFVGSATARFTGFVLGPRGVLGYLRDLFAKSGEPVVGHNPLGGWSVVALLGLMIVEVGLGLFCTDTDGSESGPLARYVSYDLSDMARGWHETLFYAILGFVALHLAAILFYLTVKRDNLVGPMITGSKRLPASVEAPAMAPAWRIAAAAAIAAAIAWWVSRGAPL